METLLPVSTPSERIISALRPLWFRINSSDANNADIVVTFEGSYNTAGENPYTAWAPAAWESKYPASDFAALVYNAPDSTATPQPLSACSKLAKQNIGYVDVGMWYDQLPTYFSTFLATPC